MVLERAENLVYGEVVFQDLALKMTYSRPRIMWVCN